MSPTIVLSILIGIVLFDFVLDQILDYVNVNYRSAELPKELIGIYTDEEYQKSGLYLKENVLFSLVSSIFSVGLMLAMLWFGGYGYLSKYINQYTDNQVFQSLIFFGVVFIVSDILSIPFQWYSTFVIEQKFGFNKSTKKIFIVDKLKGYALMILIGGILLTVFLYLVKYLGADFWIYFWLVISAFILIMNLFYTSLIVPLFNKLTPLEDGELKSAINDYCQKVNFPLDNLFVVDGSKRSNKANAYFSGLGKKKKVVLYDTLIQNHTTEELVAVLAHEVGHFKKKHIVYSLIIGILQMGLILFILSKMIFSLTLSQALGSDQMMIHLNLIAFSLIFQPISEIIGIAMNIFSRKNEYEADDYAKNTYAAEPLIEALKKLSSKNLSNPVPHPWYIFVHYSHPSILQRFENLRK